MNKKEIRKAVGLRLKKVRKALFLTQERFVAFFDTGRTNYTRNERGDTFPNCLVLYKLATDFDISLDWLIGEKGPMYYKEKTKKESREKMAGTPAEREQQEFLACMDEIPEMRQRVMGFFRRFRKENERLVKSALKKPPE